MTSENRMAQKSTVDENNGDTVNVETVVGVPKSASDDKKMNSSDKKKRPANDDDRVSTAETDESPSKKSKSNDDTNNTSNAAPLDLAKTFGFKAGDRLEVEWEIVNNNNNNSSGADNNANNEEDDDENVHKHWWTATLLEHDGRTEDSVAIRTLDYDPYPEGGFPERSQEDVIFLGRDLLIDPETHTELHYRREGGASHEDVCLGKDGIEQVVNETLMKAMNKNSTAWNQLSRAQQASIAEKIAVKKEKLMDLLLNHPKGVITSQDMKSILSQTMEEEEE